MVLYLTGKIHSHKRNLQTPPCYLSNLGIPLNIVKMFYCLKLKGTKKKQTLNSEFSVAPESLEMGTGKESYSAGSEIFLVCH